jgi:hypothetical protein
VSARELNECALDLVVSVCELNESERDRSVSPSNFVLVGDGGTRKERKGESDTADVDSGPDVKSGA